MRCNGSHRAGLGALCLAGLSLGAVAAAEGPRRPDPAALARLPAPAPRKVDFGREVLPLLEKRCFACHSGSQLKGGLRLDRREGLVVGGDAGAAIRPGKSAESLLIHYVAAVEPKKVMPPVGARLTPAEVGILRAWIDQGATWPADSRVSTNAPGTTHWAFRPVKRPSVPAVRNAAWVRNPVDAFVLARLEREKVRPSPYADRVTLLRRLSLDLTGLPPATAEVEAFVNDRSPHAYEKVVDRLLASPHFGERWGRHWLDLARYADSDGYEKDLPRPFAYLYRDWVIEAFNRDLPFDEFTIQQLAGDLLPNASLEQKIATGFHRNTLKNREGGIDPEEDRVKNTVDRVGTTGTAWLGLTVACAECHTHKFDPITQREFYGLYAFFNGVDEVDLPANSAAEAEAYETDRAAYERDHAPLVKQLEAYEREKLPEAQIRWELALASARGKLPKPVTAALLVKAGDRTPEQRSAISEYFRTIDPEYQRLSKAVAAHAKREPVKPARTAMTLAERAQPRPTNIHIRGDFLRKGAAVEPHTLAVLPTLAGTSSSRPTRLDLAKWIASPANPLTARVAVNRVWQNLFGRGLVATPNDFGTRGEAPSHPELLDWLASVFSSKGTPNVAQGGRGQGSGVREGTLRTAAAGNHGNLTPFADAEGAGGARATQVRGAVGSNYALRTTHYAPNTQHPTPNSSPQGLGWSTKSLIKLIVMSATYQQSSQNRADLAERDPKNVLLARQSRFRVEAEIVRDLYLAASGLLHREIGGPSIRPPLPADIAALGYAGSVKWAESKGAERYKRGMYIFFQRTVPYPMLATFDAPDSNAACTRRERSNTPLQALTLLNDPVFVDAARALGRKMGEAAPGDPAGAVREAFRLCLSREPSESEVGRLVRLYADVRESFRKDPEAGRKFAGEAKGDAAEQAACVAVARVVLNLDEMVTRE